MPGKFSTPQQRAYLAGAIILAAGLIAALLVFVNADAAGDASAGDERTARREAYQLARLGGTATVRTVQFDSWLGSLWHGQRLAFTLAVLSLVVAGGCFYIGGLLGEEVEERR